MNCLKPKFILSFLFFVLMCIGFSGCHVHHPGHKVVVVKHKHIPPGHAKKIYGDKSAKKHAPGQHKKHKGHDHD